ncbi:MAG: transcriptional repressor [Alphaproteobacteria bacterium]|nr:transcriptional repressor [Alphaproteobacteria bacterium]
MAKIGNDKGTKPATSGRNPGEPEVAEADHGGDGIAVTLAEARCRLVAAGLRPTRPRLRLLRLLVEAGERHFTPNDLTAEARAAGLRLPLATIYNSLNCFAEAGLLKKIAVGPGKVFFDTDTRHHHHFYCEESGELRSVPARQDGLVDLPDDLAEIAPERLNVVVRVQPVQTKTRSDER